MNEWMKKIRSSVQSVMDSKRRKSASPSTANSKHTTATDRPHTIAPVVELPPVEAPQLPGLTKTRARGPPRRRPSPRTSQQTGDRTVSCPPSDTDPARRRMVSSCRDLVYEYSSSEESDTSEKTSRPSTRQNLNTTMPEIPLPPARRSASPAPQSGTRTSRIYQQRAAAAVCRQTAAPCLTRRSRASVPSLFAPRKELEREFGGGTSSTGSSSLSNLTSTLTREGQMLPALLTGLERASLGLRQCSAREAGLAGRLTAAEGNLATARADISRLQDKVTSLQIVVATTSSKMMAFTEMFQTVDEQLRDMWSEMDSVNSSVHRVMHRSAEHQRQNERLFAQLEAMQDRLVASPPGGAAGGGRRGSGGPAGGRRRASHSPAESTGRTDGPKRAQMEANSPATELDLSAVEDPLSHTLVI